MQLLLDTHALLWWLADSPRLKRAWRSAIADPQSRVVVSAASIWEIAIKSSLGQLRLDLGEDLSLADLSDACGFDSLPIRAQHAAGVVELPPLHADPFDRILIAQANAERLTLVSADAAIAAYDVDVLA